MKTRDKIMCRFNIGAQPATVLEMLVEHELVTSGEIKRRLGKVTPAHVIYRLSKGVPEVTIKCIRSLNGWSLPIEDRTKLASIISDPQVVSLV